MVLGGGLAVLVLACFFFQHSKATPVQPVEPASPAADSPALSAETAPRVPTRSPPFTVPADSLYPLTIPAEMTLGKVSLQIPLEKLDQELKLSLTLRLQCDLCHRPSPSPIPDEIRRTFQFDNFPHSPVLRTTGGDGRTTLTFEMPENWQVARGWPPI